MKMLAAVALSAVLAAPAFAQSNEYSGPAPRSRAAATTDQIIVKWRDDSLALMADPSAQRASKLSTAGGVAIQHKRRSTSDTEVFKLSRAMPLDELQAVLDRLNADPAVAFAVADQRRWVQALPTDPLYAEQWYFQDVEPAGTRAEQAWDITTGSPDTIVAVLDTGVRFEHPDLGRRESGGKLLAGYDFVTDPRVANDGDGRDGDASDPGDWINATDRSQAFFSNCDLDNSSWHGTRVSSLIGALTNDGVGLAGSGWSTLILPVRVLGKCGGFDSDIIDGMRWSAGLPVVDAPLNTTPANIINLSLGGTGACNAAYQSAVNEVTAQGSLIVASVGNEGTAVGVPANCDGVLGVSGVRHAGTKVGYSSLGRGADIAAPAGNCVNLTITDETPCVYSLLVATNSGTTIPAVSTYTDRVVRLNFGTSFSAPLVSGAAALIHAVSPGLTPFQVTAVLQGTSTAFPTGSSTTTTVCRTPTANTLQSQECICTTATCGAGMLDTASAITALSRPFGIVQAPATLEPNVDVSIDGRSSFDADGGAVSSYEWSVLDVTGAMPVIADAAMAATTLQVPGTSQFTLRLRVTGEGGMTDDTDFAMAAAPITPPATTPIGSGGTGGGGSFDWWLLVLGLLPLALPGPRRRKTARVRSRSMPRTPSERDAQDVNGSANRSHRRRRRQHLSQ